MVPQDMSLKNAKYRKVFSAQHPIKNAPSCYTGEAEETWSF